MLLLARSAGESLTAPCPRFLLTLDATIALLLSLAPAHTRRVFLYDAFKTRQSLVFTSFASPIMARTRRDPPQTCRRQAPSAEAIKVKFTPGKKRAPPPKTVDIAGVKMHPTAIFDTFYQFVVERYLIHKRRLAGSAPPWTNDPILASYPFTNVFRVFDRVTQYILRNVINRGDQSLEEQCFRVMLFRTFNKIETWELLKRHFGEITWSGFDHVAYEKVLLAEHRRGNALYNAAYIISGVKLGADSNVSNHLRLVEIMMRENLPAQLQSLEHLRDAHGRIALFPCMGDFMALQ